MLECLEYLVHRDQSLISFGQPLPLPSLLLTLESSEPSNSELLGVGKERAELLVIG